MYPLGVLLVAALPGERRGGGWVGENIGLLEYPLNASTEKSKTGISFRDPLLCLVLSGSRVPWLPIKIERKTA
jgi:hypothetical protein